MIIKGIPIASLITPQLFIEIKPSFSVVIGSNNALQMDTLSLLHRKMGLSLLFINIRNSEQYEEDLMLFLFSNFFNLFL